MRAPEPWAVIDTWRSIWLALALVHGGDPDAAVAGHQALCAAHGWEEATADAEPGP